MRHFIPFVLALAPLVVAVDRNNFKTCKDSSFCDRRRKFEGEGEKYKGMSSNTIIFYQNHLRESLRESPHLQKSMKP